MKLPPVVFLLGFAGLLPCFADPLWLSFAPASAPAWLDHLWITYVALVASFMAGTFWGFSAPAAQGVNGLLGLLIASLLMLLTWGAAVLPFKAAAGALALVYVLQIAAEVWRERALDTIPGYFRLRAQLTVGVVAALLWRLALP